MKTELRKWFQMLHRHVPPQELQSVYVSETHFSLISTDVQTCGEPRCISTFYSVEAETLYTTTSLQLPTEMKRRVSICAVTSLRREAKFSLTPQKLHRERAVVRRHLNILRDVYCTCALLAMSNFYLTVQRHQ